MKIAPLSVSLALAASALLAPGVALAVKPCEELKQEIAAKLDAKGVAAYTLEIVAPEAVAEGQRVVGSCDGGTHRIVYTRGEAAVAKTDEAAPAQ
jgi:hypothetical protein